MITNIKNSILAVASITGAFIANQLGGWDVTMKMLVAAIILDYITGIMVAGVFKRSTKTESGALESRAGFKGICRKGMILALVWLSVLLDNAIGMSYIRTTVCLFFVANESLSILENIGLMGVPYPAFLKNMLESLKKQNDEGGTDDNNSL